MGGAVLGDLFCYNGIYTDRIGLFGLGKSNIGVLTYISRHFPTLNVTLRCDGRVDFSHPQVDRVLCGKAAFSPPYEKILFLSPSVRRDRYELFKMKNAGVHFSSDAELFFSLRRNNVFAVTGSDGKSTTTYLTSRLLLRSFDSAIPCGNFGESMSLHIDDSHNTAFVSELSSFQLCYLAPRVRRALITNISKNHLNWHRDFIEYVQAKRRVLEHAEERVLNFDCKISRSFFHAYPCFAVFSQKLCEEDLSRRIDAKIYLSEREDGIYQNGELLLPFECIRLSERHNRANFMAAAALAYGYYDKSELISLAESFSGLAHRCERFFEADGIKFINSSIDSSPKRTQATLMGLSERVILILGGRSKGLDYRELIPALRERAKAVIATGEAMEKIQDALSSALKDFSINFYLVEDFFGAIDKALDIAKCGDTILLSPASTSYDRFCSFEERGDTFKEYIKRSVRGHSEEG